jgi:hypothetical protein
MPEATIRKTVRYQRRSVTTANRLFGSKNFSRVANQALKYYLKRVKRRQDDDRLVAWLEGRSDAEKREDAALAEMGRKSVLGILKERRE